MRTTHKAVHGRSAARRRKGRAHVEREFPPALRDVSRQVRAELDHLEKEIERASVRYRRSAARLLRSASQRLGRVQATGQGGWRRLAGPYRRDAQRLLARLGRAVAPPRRRRAKIPARGPRRKAAPKAAVVERPVAGSAESRSA